MVEEPMVQDQTGEQRSKVEGPCKCKDHQTSQESSSYADGASDSRERSSQLIQREHFHKELQVLELTVVEEMTPKKLPRQRNLVIKISSCLYHLDPFLDKYGLIHVGGYIK